MRYAGLALTAQRHDTDLERRDIIIEREAADQFSV